MAGENKNYCVLYIMRHGETEANKQGVVNGHTDAPLTEEGVKKLQATAEKLKDVSFGAVFSSDLPRAMRTAEIITLERQLATQTSHLLRERLYGKFEERPTAEYREAVRQAADKLKQLSEKERWAFKLDEGMESDDEVASRFITRLREIAVTHPGKVALVVTHGGCIRTFLMRMNYLAREDFVGRFFENGGYLKVRSDGIDFFIDEVNGISDPRPGGVVATGEAQ